MLYMQLLRRLSFTMLLMSMMTLVACGDGDGDLTGGGTDPDPDPVVTLTLSKSDGDLSGENDITISATVTQDSIGIANKLVTFKLTDATLATFSTQGSASTDSNGLATIVVQATGFSGGVEVTASITDVDPAAISFNSTGGGVVVIPPVGPVAASISLFASSQQLSSSDSQKVTLTAIAKDGNNNLLEGVTINFASTSDSSLGFITDETGTGTNVTGLDGTVKMVLSAFKPENRTITVTAESGTASDSIEVQVVGTSISLSGSSAFALDDQNNFVIKVLDSDGVSAASGTTVSLSLLNESTEGPEGDVANIEFSSSSVVIDSSGQASVVITGKSGGTNTIVASSLGTTTSHSISVEDDSFLFTNFSNGISNVDPTSSTVREVLLSKTANVTLTWFRSGVPVPDGTVVRFTRTRGILATETSTTVAGKVTASLTSINAGKTFVTFTGTYTKDNKVIELNNQLEFEFVADTADKIIVQASPNSVGPNGQTSTISVVVRDDAGNLVKNKKVDFSLSDVSNGGIEPAFDTTDSNGAASTVYTSNQTSAKNKVVVSATVRDAPAVTGTVDLTVGQRELYITLGSGNSLVQVDSTTYNKQYSIFVTDINSQPIPDRALTISAIPKEYYKGSWGVVLKDGEFDHYAPFYTATCANEDGSNGGVIDGILEVSEDFNGNEKLTPGNIVNAGRFDLEVITDDNGRVVFDILYAEVYATWANIDLIVSARVDGTEGDAQVLFNLPVMAEDVTNEGNPPEAFIWPIGPFGASADCSNPD